MNLDVPSYNWSVQQVPHNRVSVGVAIEDLWEKKQAFQAFHSRDFTYTSWMHLSSSQ